MIFFMSNLGNHHEIEKKRNSWKIGNQNRNGPQSGPESVEEESYK